MTDIINKQTLSEQIYQILRQDILTQNIESGQKLTLQSLKDRFEVSHTPIRDALTRLVEDDLVIYYSNVGIKVVQPTANDAREIFQLSGDLDCLALRYCLQGSHLNELTNEMSTIIDHSKQYLQEQNFDQWREFSDRFHLVFYQFADNSRLEQAAQKLRAQITLLSNLYQIENKYSDKIQEDHDSIYYAIRDRNHEGALALLREHLDHDLSYAVEAITQYEAQRTNRSKNN